jgi:hypothetical protein
MTFEIELLDRRLDVPEDRIWDAVSRYWEAAGEEPYISASAFIRRKVTDIRTIRQWHGDYDGIELELTFPKDGDRLIWFGVTYVGDSAFRDHEHILGYVEVHRTLINADTPVDVRVVCAWKPFYLFFKGMADTILCEFTRQPVDEALAETLHFKSLVERQTHRDIFVEGRAQENIARALLQTFLVRRSYREVPVRGGRSDILVLDKQGRFLYEAKIWKGITYFEQGLREIEEYVIGEDTDGRLAGIFYVLFDPTKSAAARRRIGSDVSSRVVRSRTVSVVVININPPKPSALS